ncbi:MAG: beta strand repeat-containing protein, partial [Stellaceae bacterium]
MTSTGTGTYSTVDLFAGGSVTNGSNALTKGRISGSASGVNINGAAGTVANFGTIQGGRGVALRAGGRVTNGSAASTAALISGTRKGVYISGAAGTVTNFGTIQGTGGVNLVAGGTVVNLGTITGAGGKQAAVRLMAGGTVTNGSTAATATLIRGVGYGVYISSAAGTVNNFGTIQGGDGVALLNGGRVTNGSAAATGALIGGVFISGAAGTVSNFGSIDGGYRYSVLLTSGGRITNGSAAATSALIGGVSISGAAGTVSNFGTIDGEGVVFYGRVTNGSAALINALINGAQRGVYISGGGGTVTNFGTISGGHDGFHFFRTYGRITNGSATSTSALISGVGYGVYIYAGGGSSTITNFGTISGGHGGVDIYIYSGGSGTVTNFGTISGGHYGVYFFRGAGTVTNFGTISGGSSGTAVGVAGKVVVEPGAVFVGSVLGGGVSEIDFAAGGVADASNVSGFATIGLSNGRHHTLTLTGPNFAAVVGAAITVDDGNAGNTVTGASLPAKDHIIVQAGAGLDKLTGGRGNDVFFAGGDTVMTGKAGKNEFTFSAPGGNTVGDFAVSAANEIVFSDKGFSLGLSGATGTPKALPADLFVENSDGHFTSTSQRFAYATGTGDLSYSASGSHGTP